MRAVIESGLISAVLWLVTVYAFHLDRSRYRNCYLLFFALMSVIPFLVSFAGPYAADAALIIVSAILLALLIVPFFLIYNGIVMMIANDSVPAGSPEILPR